MRSTIKCGAIFKISQNVPKPWNIKKPSSSLQRLGTFNKAKNSSPSKCHLTFHDNGTPGDVTEKGGAGFLENVAVGCFFPTDTKRKILSEKEKNIFKKIHRHTHSVCVREDAARGPASRCVPLGGAQECWWRGATHERGVTTKVHD